ncbi:MAG TPA: hypothetical protein VJT75_05995 [Thermoleophilaceae bacterium]|nr:hypothetical protein [Thermoleophilaceae bacterium]
MRTRGLAALAASAAVLAAVPGTSAAARDTRYSLAHGCYALHGAQSGRTPALAGRIRMQPTTLGRYLIYRPDRTFVAAQGDGSVAPDGDASPAADWRVSGDGPFTLAPMSDTGRRLTLAPDGSLRVAAPGAGEQRFTFAPAAGCAVYPEVGLSARGTPARGRYEFAAVRGLLEGHMHWMNFEFLGGEFQCGRPWHAYGVPHAMPDCSSVEGPQGSAAPVQNFLNYGSPEYPHDTTGWPKFTEWGAHNLTYNGVYWRWVQRAWLAGQRVMVNPINENRVLCELMPRKHNSCDEMDAVRLALRDMRELQRYADAQAGGPGRGFFQIVTTPNAARRVVNRGQMAVVLEIEISELFGCRGWETSTCDRKKIDRDLAAMHRMGVRSSLLLNKFDNPLTGVRFDSGPVGVLINAGNRQSAGTWWAAKTCTGPLHDNEILQPPGSPEVAALLAAVGLPSGGYPTYPPAPHCNRRGLTDLGHYLERRMIKRHWIINPDHMSQRAVADTLTLAESYRYSGVISPHGWMDPGNWPRIWKLGGLAFPDSDTADNFVRVWRRYRPRQTPYKLGWGEGADLGGLAAQPDARAGAIRYPFKSYDGRVTFDRQRSGQRTFDYNKEGVAHYGLYPDWYEDVRKLGGAKLKNDMMNGAEAYLEMWERARGVRVRKCTNPFRNVTAHGLGKIRLGMTWERLLSVAGQPQQRNRAWSWCVREAGNLHAADVAELTPAGRVELIGSTAVHREGGGTAIGTPVERVRDRTTRIAPGLFVRHRSGGIFVYAVRKGRVRAVAVATPSLARRRGALRAAMYRLLTAKASHAARRYVGNASEGSQRLQGKSLVDTSDPRLNAALAKLCGLN